MIDIRQYLKIFLLSILKSMYYFGIYIFIIYSVFNFSMGLHNLDLMHNARVFEEKEGVELLDYDGNGVTEPMIGYSNAFNQIIYFYMLSLVSALLYAFVYLRWYE